MKTVLVALALILAVQVSCFAQVFEYNEYCYGMKFDSCKQIINRSTCVNKVGIILFFKSEIKIDSGSYYIHSTDTIQTIRPPQVEKIIYYCEATAGKFFNEPVSIIFDKTNRIVTIITRDRMRKDLLDMDFYILRLKY